MNDQHAIEVDRLWGVIRRDLSSAILEFAGFKEGQAFDRLMKNWDKLCKLDLDVAAHIHHGVEQIEMAMGRHNSPNSPSERQVQQLNELIGLGRIAREKHPDTDVETLGELINVADKSIRDEIDDETGGLK